MTENSNTDKNAAAAKNNVDGNLCQDNAAHNNHGLNDVNQVDLNQVDLNQVDLNQVDLNQTGVDQIDVNQTDLKQPILNQLGLHQHSLLQHSLLQHSLHQPSQNHILAALPAADLDSLNQYLQLVNLPVGTMLYEPGQESRYAYFPTSCVISLQHMLESGRTAETASVGNDGMLGVALFMGGDSTPSSAVVQISGYAYQLDGHVLKQEFKRLLTLQQLLLRYTQVLLTQISLTAVCYRHHSLQQQLCRWLLLTLDRLNTNEITMTQELVAGMLGVRREGITEAAGHLQREGLITYRRGHITVINRTGIETHVCECYGVLKKELLRLLPEPP